MAAAGVCAASPRIVQLALAFVLAGGVFSAAHPSHGASPPQQAPHADASRAGTTPAGDATGEEADAAWQEYTDALRGVLCPLDANFLSCVERRVVCELKSTVRKLGNFSDAQPWLKYVEKNFSDNDTSDGDGCDPESQGRSAPASARGRSEAIPSTDAKDHSDAVASSQDVAHNSSQRSTTETVPRTLKMSMMMPMMLLGPMMMLGFLPFQLANLKGMVMMAMMLSNMALMSAIMTTIRNTVFGRRPGHHVVYKNYGYANEQKQKWIPHHPTVFHHG